MPINRYSQRDPLWAIFKMGNSTETLGKSGCTTTSIANGAGWFGFTTTPAWWAKKIEYTSQGLILWPSINKLPLPFKWEYRYYSTDPKLFPALSEALKNPNKFVIVEIRHSHWVLATSFILGILTALDPWTLPTATKNIYGKGYITGCSVFVKK